MNPEELTEYEVKELNRKYSEILKVVRKNLELQEEVESLQKEIKGLRSELEGYRIHFGLC